MIFLTIEQTSPQNQKFGRTVPDLLIHSIYFLVGIGFLLAFAFFSYLLLGSIPMWFWISILMSFIFIPFLSERAKEKANLFVVIDEPFKMSEFRIGKKYGLKIQGKGVKYQSHSGIDRMILSDLDLKNKIGKGVIFSLSIRGHYGAGVMKTEMTWKCYKDGSFKELVFEPLNRKAFG